jgi:glycosyltransferase involved in cell wall biosynthesis
MRDKPLVSVILPVHNGEKYLTKTIEDILHQTYYRLELIVVDDGSTDGSRVIACHHPQVRCLCQENQGPGAARNTGIAAAQGSLLAFQDQDDRWPPDKTRRQVDYLLSHPDVGYVLGRVQPFLEEGMSWPRGYQAEYYEQNPVAYFLGASLIRRETFDQVGLLDISRNYADDLDWFLRARAQGITMAVLPDVVLFKRIHESNLSQRDAQVQKDILGAVRASLNRRRVAGK